MTTRTEQNAPGRSVATPPLTTPSTVPTIRTSAQSPTKPRHVQARERELRAVRLRTQGLTFAAIGAELGVSHQAAQQAVVRALEATRQELSEGADELRALEALRLERMTEVLWSRVEEGDLRAIDRVIRIRESFRRLTGLDMAQGAGEQGPQVIVVDARAPWERPDVIDGHAVEADPR